MKSTIKIIPLKKNNITGFTPLKKRIAKYNCLDCGCEVVLEFHDKMSILTEVYLEKVFDKKLCHNCYVGGLEQ